MGYYQRRTAIIWQHESIAWIEIEELLRGGGARLKLVRVEVLFVVIDVLGSFLPDKQVANNINYVSFCIDCAGLLSPGGSGYSDATRPAAC